MITIVALWIGALSSLVAGIGFYVEHDRTGAAVTYLMYSLAAAGFAFDTMRSL